MLTRWATATSIDRVLKTPTASLPASQKTSLTVHHRPTRAECCAYYSSLLLDSLGTSATLTRGTDVLCVCFGSLSGVIPSSHETADPSGGQANWSSQRMARPGDQNG